ncbi:MAG: ABC transporter substrate-binding protein [Bacteroidales bacterium OttesenSCG-928-I14]|jgi:iron complex transport system substrate-binding protein|nr:ABC transporter substrate-binding protein [Bacteroidales bacterium OttesenSCG-928-I14]
MERFGKELLFCLLFFSFACCNNKQNHTYDNNESEVSIPNDTVYYAKGFHIETHAGYTLVKIRNPLNKSMFRKYILVPRSKTFNKIYNNGILIRTPLKRVVCFSSVMCEVFDILGILNTLIGVTDQQYIELPAINNKIVSGLIYNVGSFNKPDIEKLFFIKSEGIFIDYFSSANLFGKLNIPVICCLNYIESHPLGQAEWIRFIGLFFDKRATADSLFFQIVSSYNELKKTTATVAFRPTVFTEMKCGHTWYMPGGNSYVANMFYDAGANYILKNDTNVGSIPLSFEVILNEAIKSNYWLIKYYSLHNITYEQLKRQCANYTLFDAYKRKNIYVCNTILKPYYHALLLHPDWLLKEMISLFHPELSHGYLFKYYEKL